MASESFEVQDIKCVDDGTGEQGIMFIAENKLVTIVLDRGRKDHDSEICALQVTLWGLGHKPIIMRIQDL
jgi:hypothetical protein